jgi:hypothetical protein
MDRPHSQLLSSLLSGRKGLIVGIATEQSIAYGRARTFRELGAELTGDTHYVDGSFHILA